MSSINLLKSTLLYFCIEGQIMNIFSIETMKLNFRNYQTSEIRESTKSE